MTRPDKILRLVFSALCLLASMGCATTFHPLSLDQVPFRDRAQAQEQKNVRASAVVLSAEETKKVFGLDLYKLGIQPVWMEIENNTEGPIFFLPVGLDPEYFAPLEVAYMNHASFSGEANEQIDKFFHEQAMRSYIPKGGVRSGFVFTNMDLGTKSFNVDLIGKRGDRRFTFFVSVPGMKVSHEDVDWKNLYTKDELVSYDNGEDFVSALEALLCCTTNADGSKQGDPLNLVIIAKDEDLHRVLIQGGWDETEKAKNGPGKQKQSSAKLPQQHRYAPMPSQYLYGRPQDAAFRKSRESVGERNNLMLWLSPLSFKGKAAWIGQISREIRLHYLENRYQIEPHVDEARTYLFQDFWYSQSLAKFGYVEGVGAASISEPRKTFLDHLYFTDGYRLVLWLSGESLSMSEVDIFDWSMAQPLVEE